MKKLLLPVVSLLMMSIGAKAQINLVNDYVNRKSDSIGTFQGIKFREAGFSGLCAIPHTGGKEFWTVSDRGVNVDAANANKTATQLNGKGCVPTYDKIYGFPSYAPKIHRIRIEGDSIKILRTISLKRPDGNTATGLLNPTGYGSTDKEVVSIDTVSDCANFSTKTVAKDIWGIDSEGIIVDKDGNFWICEEGGPTIWKVSPNGIVIKRFTPYANMPNSQPQDIAIDSVFKYRKNNRGFEGIALAPNGKVYAIIQSPLLYPKKADGENSRVHRILEINPQTNATKMYAYLNDGIITDADPNNEIRLKDWKIGDLTAINDTTFLVLEAALRGTNDIKRLYKINISGATVVTGGAVYNTKTLEALTDSTGLANNNIIPVKKTLVMDLLAKGWPVELEKAEGITIINDSTIAICNDNDYGQTTKDGAEDGVAVATTHLSHLLVFNLHGNDKLKNFMGIKTTNASASTSTTPYIIPSNNKNKATSLLTVGDEVNGYKMAGLPDGLGAFDNNNGTFTLLMNHEISNSLGVVRAHGAKGAFVSKWTINKSDLKVVEGEDLMKKVYNWNTANQASETTPSTIAFNRFCSADLPAVSAYYNANTGNGTQERIFMNGEESGSTGYAMAHVVTGTEAGNSYVLGKFCLTTNGSGLTGVGGWENLMANPYPQDKTIVMGANDGGTQIMSNSVSIYIGTKTNTGSEIEKAGLTNGVLKFIKVKNNSKEIVDNTTRATNIVSGTAFTLSDTSSTTFSRPEDGAWDPKNPNHFYYVTTDRLDLVNDGLGAQIGRSRLWRLNFSDITMPENGGTIDLLLDGTEGQVMFDNMTIDNYGHALLQEDVGNAAHNGKMWQYSIDGDSLKIIAKHDDTRFGNVGVAATAPFSQDEETSGIIDMEEILGAGNFLLVDQAHYATTTELVEGGQLLNFFNFDTYAAFKKAKSIGTSTNTSPYIEATKPGVKIESILTVGDSVGTNNYKMVGLPDGLGAFDNNDGTFTLLMNHEINTSLGVVRAHGAKGAFVSKWTINKSDLKVVAGEDLIKKVYNWNTVDQASETSPSTIAFNRLCSADLPAISAYYNANTGKGTQTRIFMNGEESGSTGSAMAHVVNGTEAGNSYVLGKFTLKTNGSGYTAVGGWENLLANPYPQDKTVVIGINDGGTSSMNNSVAVYIGSKTNAGTEVEKAGLMNGVLKFVSVTNNPVEVVNKTTRATNITSGTEFTLTDTASTYFSRPEDGAWDPKDPTKFYFVTTDQIDLANDGLGAQIGRSRLWRLNFSDITMPENGGTIDLLLDGSEGQVMFDNMTLDNYGHALLQEDVGNAAHNGKIWQYSINGDSVKIIAKHDDARFGNIGVAQTAPFSQDEETSGIIDMEEILGAGNFILVDQAHYSIPGELVEGGQLLKLFNPDTYKASLVITNTEVEQALESEISIYPNPTSETTAVHLSLVKNEIVTVKVLDLQGNQAVPTTTQNLSAGKQQIAINTKGLSAGIYLVEVTTSTKTARIKIVVLH